MMVEGAGYSVRIIDVTKIPSAESGRVGKYDAVVTYQDAAGRIRVVTIPWEKLADKTSEEQLNIIAEYVRKNEGFRKALIGKEITV